MISTLISSRLIGTQEREVVFTLTDDIGLVHGPSVEFRPAAEDVPTFLAAQVAATAIALRDAEIADNVSDVLAQGSLAAPTLRYSTAAQNFAALRLAYQTATHIQAVMIGDFLDTLSSAALQIAFGMTAGQVTTLKTTKLTPAATLAASIRANAGQ